MDEASGQTERPTAGAGADSEVVGPEPDQPLPHIQIGRDGVVQQLRHIGHVDFDKTRRLCRTGFGHGLVLTLGQSGPDQGRARFGDQRVRRVQLPGEELALAQEGGGDLSVLMRRRHQDGDDDENRTVMMTFESLGGIVTGCEFGAVQRAYGAEPLGLLRWSGMATHTLIDLLERKLRDVGNPDTTQIGYFDQAERREYAIKDLTFGFTVHSHIYEDQMDEKTVFQQVTKRMRFLRRKILEDLTQRDKIFLFKDTLREPLPEEVDRLSAAMRSYGDGLLLIVVSAGDGKPGGSLRVVRDNLWFGYLDFNGEYGEERVVRWLQLCRNAHRWFQQPAETLLSRA